MSIARDAVSSEASLAAVLRSAARLPDKWTASDAHSIHSALQQHGDAADLRVAFAGNFTLEPLPVYAATECARNGLAIHTFSAGFDQYFVDVLSDAGELARFEPHVAVLMLSLRRLAPRVYHEFGALSDTDLEHEREAVCEHVAQWIAAYSKRTSGRAIIAGFPTPAARHLGIADSTMVVSELDFFQQLNTDLRRLAMQSNAAVFLDVERVVARVGLERAYDPRLYYLAKMVFSDIANRALADALTRTLYAVAGRTKKCLIVDLDDTLWGGIVGEDGPRGIRIGQGDATSEAYLDVQHAIRALKTRGVILGICSKNNEADVLEAFNENSSMPLSLADFAARRINWQPKPDNLRELAAELNIGLDSMVFLDDNERECVAVREMLPEVEVIHLDGDPASFADRLQRLVAFERITLTQEDRVKTDQYHQVAGRRKLQAQAGSLEQFLADLETRATLRVPGPAELPRVQQLFTKTNQFNLTTIRYNLADIQRFVTEPTYSLGILEACDRFGELGIIGLFLLQETGEDMRIDSLILSCRAIGRGLETVMLNAVKERARARKLNRILAEYRPTTRNQQVENLYGQQGFQLLSEEEDGTRFYAVDSEVADPVSCEHIAVDLRGMTS
jgi:FkbH-like protein